MPINKHPYDADIDSIIDSAELNALRKKYDAIDSDTEGSESPETAPDKEPASSFNSATPIESEAAEQPQAGDTQAVIESGQSARMQPDDTETFSNDSLEKLMSSFRIVYEESVSKLGSFSVADEIASQPPNSLSEPIPEKAQSRETPDKNEQLNDFLSSLRIVYEEAENDLPAEIQTDQSADEHLLEPIQEPAVEPEIASLFENLDPSAGLAELFHDLSEDNTSPREGTFKRMMKKVFPCKGDGIGEAIRKMVLFAAVITMIVCGVILLNLYVVAPYFSSRESQKAIDIKINSNLSADWATAEGKYPGIDFPTGMQLKYAEFYAINKDFSGWLEIPGAGIDMPIVKGKDNSEYLKKSFYGEKSKYGCCFLDSSNNIEKLDRNTIIYGHNMSYDNLMFGPLEVYKKIDGFRNSPVINFGTLYKDTKWKIYAVFVMNGSSNDDNGYLFNYIFRNLSSDDAFHSYIKQLDQRKLYTTGVDILPTDKILTLSTCLYDFKNARLAVVARLVREGESEEVDVSKASVNKNPRYPQKWYDAVNQVNPYKDAEKWFPN